MSRRPTSSMAATAPRRWGRRGRGGTAGATMPYIALQLVGMGVVIKALGFTGELPLAAAFVILALYTYTAGLRAPALIAFVKDLMIYIVVIAAVVLIPMKVGGYASVFSSARDAFAAKGGATGLTLHPGQFLP